MLVTAPTIGQPQIAVGDAGQTAIANTRTRRWTPTFTVMDRVSRYRLSQIPPNSTVAGGPSAPMSTTASRGPCGLEWSDNHCTFRAGRGGYICEEVRVGVLPDR